MQSPTNERTNRKPKANKMTKTIPVQKMCKSRNIMLEVIDFIVHYPVASQ